MKILVTELENDIEINIYGIDGDDHTKEFFEMYLFDNTTPLYIPSEDILKKYNSEAEYAVDEESEIRILAEEIPDIQLAIDDYALIEEHGQKTTDLRKYIV